MSWQKLTHSRLDAGVLMCVLPRVILEADVVDIPLAKIIKEVFQGRRRKAAAVYENNILHRKQSKWKNRLDLINICFYIQISIN